eukprot:2243973-Rhodomonas_salina.2
MGGESESERARRGHDAESEGRNEECESNRTREREGAKHTREFERAIQSESVNKEEKKKKKKLRKPTLRSLMACLATINRFRCSSVTAGATASNSDRSCYTPPPKKR